MLSKAKFLKKHRNKRVEGSRGESCCGFIVNSAQLLDFRSARRFGAEACKNASL